MRLSSLLQAVGALAIFNIGLVTAAPSGHSNRYSHHHHGHSHGYGNSTLTKRTRQYFCDHANSALVASVNEIKAMLTTTIDRTTALEAFVRNPPAHILQHEQLLQSTFYTFESIFGRLEYGVQSGEAADSISRVQRILGATGLEGIVDNPDLEIYCSDAWLVREDREGDVDMTNSYLYWDNRETRTEDYAENFETVHGACRDSNTHYAWVNPSLSSSKTTSGRTNVMTLCQDNVAEWITRYNNGQTIETFSKHTLSAARVRIDSFQGQTMSTAMMHEFTHASAIVGTPYLIDESCTGPDDSTVAAYGWFCISQLAKYAPARAINNADSFSIYATAMYLSLDDWSYGYPREILSVTNPLNTGIAALMSHTGS
ncbi:uncharacterized protein N7515_009516 [Penicillium bovifimosum]|uniref:Lysine-specific metallo-endopeptidase domain-containing protein n=1 Tax=Penicillium bovifimosum TaxID=126998 RepID=A0A9W9GJS0_9EURO|nr:uncharacterized protein N7515_009516 [Penicillium bovifimosum]KAJ5121555.1 hypothetical protein N7515_009516 [Penicillium bovifimosum]